MPIQRIQRDIQAISLHAPNMPIKNLELTEGSCAAWSRIRSSSSFS